MVSRVSPETYATLKFFHFAAFAAAVGGALAVQRAVRTSREHSAGQRAGLEIAARKLAVSVEISGAFGALIFGIALLVADDFRQLKPATSGAGPWLHLKLTLVMIALVVSHLRMFRLARLVRMRDSGGTEAELDALTKKAMLLGNITLVLYMAIIFVAVFRFVLFTNT